MVFFADSLLAVFLLCVCSKHMILCWLFFSLVCVCAVKICFGVFYFSS